MFSYNTVFPCNPETKRPLIPTAHPEGDPLHKKCKGECGKLGHGLYDATDNPVQIAEWADEYPNRLWGFPTGKEVFVLDVDKKSGGLESWNALTDRYGVPNTYTVQTFHGGLHFYFTMPTGTVIYNSASKFAQGIDVRGEGGYVIIPLDTEKYKVINDVDPIPAPEWIMFRLNIEVARAGVNVKAFILPDVIYDGERHDTLFRYGCSLQARGKTDEEIQDALFEARERFAPCDKPTTDEDILDILKDVLKYEKGTPRFSAHLDGVAGASKNATPAEYRQAIIAMGYTFKRNEANDAIFVNGHQLDDYDKYELMFNLGNLGYTSSEKTEIAYYMEAKDNTFHPIRDYLNGLKWDGRDYIGELATYFEDNDCTFELYLKKWLVGCVAKVLPYSRGVQNRTLVLVGKQGSGKSYFPRWLCKDIPQYHIEGSIRPDDKDHHIRKMSKWIWEVSELGSTTRRADLEALKDFLANENVTVRVPFGRNDISKPPMANFLATVNDEGTGFLNDPTGSRRFMVCSVNRIDKRYSENIQPKNIWAQAVALLNAGFDWNLSATEEKQAEEINSRHEVESPMSFYLSKFFDIDKDMMVEWVTPTGEIVDVLKSHNVRESERAMQMEVAKVLKKAGLSDDRLVLDGYSKKVKCWRGIRVKKEYETLDQTITRVYSRVP